MDISKQELERILAQQAERVVKESNKQMDERFSKWSKESNKQMDERFSKWSEESDTRMDERFSKWSEESDERMERYVGAVKEELDHKFEAVMEYVQDIPKMKDDIASLQQTVARMEPKLDATFEQTGRLTIEVEEIKATLARHERQIQR